MRPLDNTDIGVTRDRRDYFQKDFMYVFSKGLIFNKTDTWLFSKNIESWRPWNDSSKGLEVNDGQSRTYIQ